MMAVVHFWLTHRQELAKLSQNTPVPSVYEARLYDAGDPEKRARCEAMKWRSGAGIDLLHFM